MKGRLQRQEEEIFERMAQSLITAEVLRLGRQTKFHTGKTNSGLYFDTE